MTYRKQHKELKHLTSNAPSSYTTLPDDPVWVRVGLGWCAAKVLNAKRTGVKVHFLTGAKEDRPYSDLRWRYNETPPETGNA